MKKESNIHYTKQYFISRQSCAKIAFDGSIFEVSKIKREALLLLSAKESWAIVARTT